LEAKTLQLTKLLG